MTATKTWKVEIYIGEQDKRTYAEARLMPGQQVTLTGTGVARLNPRDRDVPEIGDELAVARALSELSHRLLHAAAGDIEQLTHEPVDLHG
ncbi:MAG: DUF1876 domain-containing protein [Actinomycetes bacterium]